ncbi:MAG: beta-ketoacyl-ACP synthase III [Polyangiales bacterium]
MAGITILGTGSYAPGEPITNDDLSRVMSTSDEWIRKRTGIAQRHFTSEGVGVSDLGKIAAERAIESAGLAPSDIDYIIFCTMTPEYFFPGSGGLLGAKLGIPRVPALDIRQQCAAVPFAFQVANGLVASKAAKRVLICGAEAHAAFMPWKDWDVLRGEADHPVDEEAYARATRHRGMAVLFGDGASAFVVGEAAKEGQGLLGTECHTDGRMYDHIYIPMGFTSFPYITEEQLHDEKHIPRMAGPELFKTAVTELAAVVESLCARNGVTLDQIDWFVAHQANDRINGAVRDKLKLPPEKVPSNIARYGNTSAATIGILTDEMRRDGRLKEGQLVCFLALGAGLNWGAALLRL